VNEDNIMKFERDPDHQPALTPEQRARLDAMTDADVEAAALADPDAQPLTEEQLARFDRVPNIKAIREKLHLSQKQFAETFGLSLSVVRDWEQGRFFPDRAARTLLKVIAHNPQAVQEALAHSNERGSHVDNHSSTGVQDERATDHGLG
jgi:putative transcriptional regulator